jgi:hypothetical protein
MFHPGVWFKNFVLAGLTARCGAAAVNLVIDADTLDQPSLRVPTREGAGASLLPFDGPAPRVPFEARGVVDRSTFESFGSRAAEVMRGWGIEPLMVKYWPLVVERARAGERLGASLAQGRRQLEAEWGFETLELPQSRVCELPAFLWFAAHLFANAGPLRDVYNGAIVEYRRLNKVRSENHPAPELARHEEWIETPFWIWTDEAPRRRPLFVAHRGQELRLGDRDRIDLVVPFSAGGDLQRTAAALGELPRSGVRLRTRALATTVYARLLLCDLFVHGIGGGKYDEVADAVIGRFFGCAPPRYAVATATLRLPLAHEPALPADVARLRGLLRELTHHPERHLPSGARDDASAPFAPFAPLVASKAASIATPQTRENARRRCQDIRGANDALQPWIAGRRTALEQELEQTLARAHRHAALSSREYAWCLFPAEELRDFLTGFSVR